MKKGTQKIKQRQIGKITQMKPCILAAILLISGAACAKDPAMIVAGSPVRQSGDITGDITADETWSADKEYLLAGRVTVKQGVTLTVEPGTRIRGRKDPPGWLQVERGAKLMAIGTRLQPIVFTSAQAVGTRQRGDWGGVVLLGRAANNVGTNVKLKGNGGTYGGVKSYDNSGTLQYVRIEYAGRKVGSDSPLNGLTLASVGAGTTLSYIQIHAGLGDGIKFWGGNVDGDHLVVSGVDDDCFDTDEGYTGGIQWAVCLQEPGHGDNGIEASNNGDAIDAEPRTFVKFSNFTFVGRGEYDSGKGNGLKFKEGTAALLSNGIVENFSEGGLDIDDAVGANGRNIDDTRIDLLNTIFYANRFTQQEGSITEGGKTFTQFTDDNDKVDEWGFVSDIDRRNQFVDPQLNRIVFQNPNLLPVVGSAVLSCPAPTGLFDRNAVYCGAFGKENWLSGWTNFSLK